MDKVCDYCQCQYDDSLDNCPHCGAPNDYVRRGDGVPKTIEELKTWYVNHNLPAEEITRFFIGKNISEPRAFGIYKDDSGDFVVYKNKDDGSRFERYRGSDESYAVNEFYLKLKEEINNQKNRSQNVANNYQTGSRSTGSGMKWLTKLVIFLIIFHVFGGILTGAGLFNSCDGNSFWSSDDYYYSEDYSYSDSSSDSDSYSSSSDDWDSDSSWSSSDSWDSGSSDWSSDW